MKSDKDKIAVLSGMLVFVVQGLRNKSIKSKPIFDTKTFDSTSLEDEILRSLKECGFEEKKK